MTPLRPLPWNAVLGGAWLGALMAIHPLPHTGALRSLLLLLGLIHVAFLFWRRRPPLATLTAAGTEGWLLALLSAWLVMQSALFAQSPGEALPALAHDWGKLLAVAALGVGLAASVRAGGEQRGAGALTTGMFLGFFLHAPLIVGYQAWQAVSFHRLLLGEGPLGNYGYVSMLVNAALAFLLADAGGRLCHGRRLLPFSAAAAVAAIAVVLVANALLISKAGLVMTHVLAWTFLAIVLRRGTAHRRLAITAVVLGLTLATAASLALQDRWGGAVAAVASGIAKADATAHTPSPTPSPATGPATRSPLQANGDKDPSFYIRSFSAKIGLQAIVQHPLGLGYGPDAFGRHLAQAHGVAGLVSSESGWIDFTLANGIPAILLFLALSWALMRRGWRVFGDGDTVGLALTLAVLNYAGRCALDGYLSGSRLTGFVLMASTLLALVAPPTGKRNAGHAD